MITVGDLRDAVSWLHAQTYLVPRHQQAKVDAAAMAVRLVLEAAAPPPTGQQWRDTRHDPMPTQVHAGYAETQGR
jgi:hypothetical protein